MAGKVNAKLCLAKRFPETNIRWRGDHRMATQNNERLNEAAFKVSRQIAERIRRGVLNDRLGIKNRLPHVTQFFIEPMRDSMDVRRLMRTCHNECLSFLFTEVVS